MSEESKPIKMHPDFLKAPEEFGKMNEAEKLASWEQAIQEDLETMRRHLPEGYVIVPVEPTDDMIKAANALWAAPGVNYVQLEPEDFYKAMIKAAQKEDE